MTQELLEAIVEAMKLGDNREFLNPVTIFKRVQGLRPQPSNPYNYQKIYDRLASKKYKDRLFLCRDREDGKKYMVKHDLPCQKCGKQDGQENFLICSSEKCCEGWHLECLPEEHRLEDVPPQEDDWFCPRCSNGHGQGTKEASKVRGAWTDGQAGLSNPKQQQQQQQHGCWEVANDNRHCAQQPRGLLCWQLRSADSAFLSTCNSTATQRVKKAAAGPTRKGGFSQRGEASSQRRQAKDNRYFRMRVSIYDFDVMVPRNLLPSACECLSLLRASTTRGLC